MRTKDNKRGKNKIGAYISLYIEWVQEVQKMFAWLFTEWISSFPKKDICSIVENQMSLPSSWYDFSFHWYLLWFVFSVIDQETFAAFTHCWKENNKQCLNLGISDKDLLESECVLRVSSLCKTDYGTGRVALTDRR